MDDFVIARNPDPDSALPYLLRLPLPRPVGAAVSEHVADARVGQRLAAQAQAGERTPAPPASAQVPAWAWAWAWAWARAWAQQQRMTVSRTGLPKPVMVAYEAAHQQ